MMSSLYRRLVGATQSKSAQGLNDKNERSHQLAASGPYCELSQLMALRWAAKTIALPKAKRISRPQSGGHRSRFRGRGMEFSEVRAYQPGDDVRSIDWRVTARRQKPHTKLFNEERERPILIACDQSQSQFFGSQITFKSVRAAEVAALFAWTALGNNDRVGGLVFSERGHQEVKPARNRKSILRFLSAITEFNHALSIQETTQVGAQKSATTGTSDNTKEFTINDALIELSRLAKPGSLVVLVSDFRHVNTDTEKHLSSIAQHNELIFVRTLDPVEEHLPSAGIYPVSNGEETLVIDSRSSTTQQRYQQWVTQHTNFLTELATKFRAPLINASTLNSASSSLHSLLSTLGR